MGIQLGSEEEAMVIDNDMLGAVQHTIQGIEVNYETYSHEIIEQAVVGEGHFLAATRP